MAQYFPPTEDVPIFDTNLFEDPNEYLTVTTANKKYLRYPNSQGIENFNFGFTVNGATSDCTFNNYNTIFNCDVDVFGSVIFKNPFSNSSIPLQIAADNTDPTWAYILNYGSVGMLGNYSILQNSRISFLAETSLGGANQFSMYTTPSNSTVLSMSDCYTSTATLDYLGVIPPLISIPSTPTIRICSTRVGASLAIDNLGILAFAGNDGVATDYQVGGSIKVSTANIWTGTNHGTIMTFSTTLSTTTVNRSVMTLTGAGFLRLGVNAVTSLAPLHISTTNSSNPMVIIDGGATTTNYATMILSNDYSTGGTVSKGLRLSLARTAGNGVINSQINDACITMLNISGSTTNCLRLGAIGTTNLNAPTIDVSNILRLGDEAINANFVGTAPLCVSPNTVDQASIFCRGVNSGTAVYGGYIQLQPPNNAADRCAIFSTGLGDLTINSTRAASTLTFQNYNIASTTTAINDCGTATAYWKNVRGLNAYITVSDERKKIDIKPSVLGLDFINDLKPVSYKWKDNTDREHFGLIAQDVKASLDKKGCGEAGMWCLADKDDSESQQTLRYTELISPMIQAIKDLTLLVSELRSEINELKNKQ